MEGEVIINQRSHEDIEKPDDFSPETGTALPSNHVGIDLDINQCSHEDIEKPPETGTVLPSNHVGIDLEKPRRCPPKIPPRYTLRPRRPPPEIPPMRGGVIRKPRRRPPVPPRPAFAVMRRCTSETIYEVQEPTEDQPQTPAANESREQPRRFSPKNLPSIEIYSPDNSPAHEVFEEHKTSSTENSILQVAPEEPKRFEFPLENSPSHEVIEEPRSFSPFPSYEDLNQEKCEVPEEPKRISPSHTASQLHSRVSRDVSRSCYFKEPKRVRLHEEPSITTPHGTCIDIITYSTLSKLV